MSGTKAGGEKARATILARDPDFYKKIGAVGGKKGTTGGFAANPALAAIAGKKGGSLSRRRRKDETEEDYMKRVEEIRSGKF